MQAIAGVLKVIGQVRMRLSVVVPLYNSALHLRECLESIRTQDFQEWECICVDDGSTDESAVILNEYAGKDGRFNVFCQKNSGAWAARNVALKVARGEWITFVDSDDVLNGSWFKTGLRIAEKSGSDLVRLGRCYGREVPNGFVRQTVSEKYEMHEGVTASAWMWNVMASGGFLWRCFIRRDVVGGLEMPSLDCKEDSVWLLGLAQRVKRVAEGRFAGYFYRATEGSLMKQNRKVSQSVAYLKALGALWAQQKAQAERDGYLDVIRRNIRASADNDVIEWVMKRVKEDDLPRERIREVYSGLESAGVFDGTSYSNRRRYWLGFLWWRRTGQIWAMKVPGLLFLWARIAINKVKSR